MRDPLINASQGAKKVRRCASQAMGWTITKPPYDFLGLWDCYDLPSQALARGSKPLTVKSDRP